MSGKKVFTSVRGSIRNGILIKMNLYKIQQEINTTHIEDVYAACRQSIDASGILSPVKTGERVCIGLPSRGISAMKDILRVSIDALQKCGADVFLVPAMGSHGGGTATGQKEVLEGYGFFGIQSGRADCEFDGNDLPGRSEYFRT